MKKPSIKPGSFSSYMPRTILHTMKQTLLNIL